jgi:hypothetical protein
MKSFFLEFGLMAVFFIGGVVADAGYTKYKRSEVENFLTRNGCVKLPPPDEQYESAKHFSHAYGCRGNDGSPVLVPFLK